MLRFRHRMRPRKMQIYPGGGQGERLLRLRQIVTGLIRFERVEPRYAQADEARQYAERVRIVVTIFLFYLNSCVGCQWASWHSHLQVLSYLNYFNSVPDYVLFRFFPSRLCNSENEMTFIWLSWCVSRNFLGTYISFQNYIDLLIDFNHILQPDSTDMKLKKNYP